MGNFTTWAALRTDILDKIANHVSGRPMVGEYQIGDTRLKYTSIDDLVELYRKTYMLESLASVGQPSSAVSYGRHRRFQS